MKEGYYRGSFWNVIGCNPHFESSKELIAAFFFSFFILLTLLIILGDSMEPGSLSVSLLFLKYPLLRISNIRTGMSQDKSLFVCIRLHMITM